MSGKMLVPALTCATRIPGFWGNLDGLSFRPQVRSERRNGPKRPEYLPWRNSRGPFPARRASWR